MSDNAKTRILTLACCVVLAAGWAYGTFRIEDRISRIKPPTLEEIRRVIDEGLEKMQTVTTTVQGQSGKSYEVSTIRAEGETLEEWGKRHAEAIRYWESQ